MAAPLLVLKTLVPEHAVLINGSSYWIRPSAALSLRESVIVERVLPRIATLMTKEELTEEDDLEASTLLKQVCAIVLEAPADVQATLSDLQRFQVFVAFTPLRSKLIPPMTGATAATATQESATGASGSRGSARTTAARRKAGTTPSQPA
jgi:hypothetical protein